MKRTPLKAKRKPGLTESQKLHRAAWHRQVTRDRHRTKPCVVCGKRDRMLIQGHHIVSQGFIKKNVADYLQEGEDREEAVERLTWDPLNGLPVCKRCHDGHTVAMQRITYEQLPEPGRVWAVANGFDSYIERNYPKEEDEDGSSNG